MADVFLGSVYATLELRNVDQFQRQLNNASESGNTFKNTMLGVFAGNLLTQGFNVVGQAIVGFAKEAVTGAADLQSSMGLLQAVTGATQAQMQKFNDTAIALGNDITLPAVSASDAADAMIELGKAGLSVNDTLAASKGVLQAAAAGNIAVADSAKIVSGALLTFGLQGSEASRVADVLAAAANASSLELGDVGLALTQAGAQASIAGLSMEQTVGIIAQMANKGISAQQAGTSLSYMLKSLVAPTDKAAGVMSDLGLKFFDADGKFIGVRESIAQLTEKTKGLTQEQKAQALSTIFGAEALKSANVLINDGTAGYDKMQVAISKQGAANDLAKARQVGFNGAVAALQNTIETTALIIGQFFLPVLTDIANFIGKNFTPILAGLGGALVGLGLFAVVSAGGFGVLGAAIWTALAPVLPFIAAGAALAAGIAILQAKFDIFGKAVAFIKPIIEGVGNAIEMLKTGDFKGGIFGLTEDSPIIGALLTIRDVAIQVGNYIGGQFKSVWDSLVKIFDQLRASLQPVIDKMVEFYQKHAEQFQTAFKIIGIVIAAITFAPLIAAVGIFIGVITVVAKILEFVANNFEIIKNVVLTVITIALFPLIAAFFIVKTAIEVIINVVKFLIDVFNAVVAVISFLVGIVVAVFTAIGLVITTVFNVIAALWTNVLKPVFDGIAFVITALFTIVFTIFSGIAEVIFTVVSTIVQIIGVILFGIVSFIYEQILKPIGQFFASIWNGIVGVVSTAVNAVMGVVTSVFNAVWGFISGIFNTVFGFVSGVWNNIYNTIAGAVRNVLNTVGSVLGGVKDKVMDAFNSALNTAKGFVGSFLSAGKDIINGIVSGISNGKNAVVNKIKDICSGALDAVKSFFGIKSPSKVMQKMFGFVMQGAQLGITNNAGGLLSAFNDATQLLPSAMSIPITASAAYAGAGGVGATLGASGRGNVTNNQGGAVSIDTVNIQTRQDDSRFLTLIGRNAELADNGIVGAGS
jgi:TP901 family phage tail tape measure protein